MTIEFNPESWMNGARGVSSGASGLDSMVSRKTSSLNPSAVGRIRA